MGNTLLGDNRAPDGANRSAVTLRVFATTLSARPGNMVDTMPTLRP